MQINTEEEIDRAHSQKPNSKKDDSLVQSDDKSSSNKNAGSVSVAKNIFGKSQKSYRRSMEKE